MKKLILSASAIALLFTACKKDDNGGGSSNTFKIGATSYTPLAVSAAGTSLGAGDAAGNTMMFQFTALPTANGTYTVGGAPGATEMMVSTMRISDTTAYLTSSTSGGSATITVSGGKVSINMPSVWAYKFTGSGPDSIQISANVTQTQ